MRALRWLALAAFAIYAGQANAADLGIQNFADEGKTLSTSNPAGFGLKSEPQEIGADLFLPKGSGPLAAVVVVPGSDGLSAGKEGAYAKRLLETGLAVLVIDPFSGRGLDNLLQDPAALSDAGDGRGCVRGARHSGGRLAHRFDRIGGLGTSRGAAVLLASAARLKPGSFKALALPYPYCPHDWRIGRGIEAPQVLMLLAGQEDEVSNDACMDLAKLYVDEDVALTLEVLPSAYHGFDSGTPGTEVPVASAKNCPLVPVEPDGTFRTSVIAGAPPKASTMAELVGAMKFCLSQGAHWGETPGSRDFALARVTSFLAHALAPSAKDAESAAAGCSHMREAAP
jgi:dienelactone hydrolase